jgi:group II intron reverse transcriptase/maturase
MQKRGKDGLPVERLYRLLYNKDLYLQAYAKLYPNKGAMTPGATPETVDGMSMDKIDSIIEAIKHERYHWTPVRRTHIKKANGKLRPLGLPTWSDKLLQEVIRSILEAFYEPQFSEHSYGFRPEKGCHTALMQVQNTWTGVKWLIEGDISQYFDTIDHIVLVNILREKINDKRFINLIQALLQAGYMEDWNYHATHSGTPQGGVLSPLLANIYLDKLDKYVLEITKAYNKGTKRALNLEYKRLTNRKYTAVKNGDRELAKELTKQMRTMPCGDPNDPNFRRLRYVRYADDFMIGIIGPKSDAEEIKRKTGVFLKDKLKLKLSEEKTLITNASNETAKFLGYEITSQSCNTKITTIDSRATRSINGKFALLLPKSVVEKKSKPYLRKGKTISLPHLTINSDYSIVVEYQMALRGLYQYYALATNVSKLGHLKWIMEESLMKTLANKHKTSKRAMYKKYATRVQTDKGKTLKCIQVTVQRDGKKPLIARFGGFSLERKQSWEIIDQKPKQINRKHTEILQRLLADHCEICDATDEIEVHHIRKLSDIKGKKNERTDWKKLMASRQRKTLMVCKKCHDLIHAGKPLPALNH